VLISLLAGAAGLLIRNLVGTLVTMLSLVIVVSPLLASVTRFANYLPDRAGALLYRSGALTPTEGGAVLGGWIVLVGAVAVVVFLRKDA
jgi:ABC-2 type transport system permease protein